MEQMRSESSRTTLQQQIRMFDSLASDVLFPRKKPLHSMPSLVHLLSTQSELKYSIVNYAGFEINYFAPDSADDEMNVIDDTLPVLPVIEKCSFQRNNIRSLHDLIMDSWHSTHRVTRATTTSWPQRLLPQPNVTSDAFSAEMGPNPLRPELPVRETK